MTNSKFFTVQAWIKSRLYPIFGDFQPPKRTSCPLAPVIDNPPALNRTGRALSVVAKLRVRS